jgi:hypothetical protein
VTPETLPLRDIHLPAPVGWWPPAPGWWVVAALALLIGILLWRRAGRRAPAPDPRSVARRELEAIRRTYAAHGDARRLAGDLSVLLRRLALSESEPAAVAGLTGGAWLDYLDRRAGAPVFTEGPGRALAEAPYRATGDVDTEGLLAACARVVERPPEVGPR